MLPYSAGSIALSLLAAAHCFYSAFILGDNVTSVNFKGVTVIWNDDLNVLDLLVSSAMWMFCSYLVPPGLSRRRDPLLGARSRERLARDVQHVPPVSKAAPLPKSSCQNDRWSPKWSRSTASRSHWIAGVVEAIFFLVRTHFCGTRVE